MRPTTGVAVHGEGAEQRLAVSDGCNARVLIFNVESRKLVATVRGPGEDDATCPFALAFNSQGELFVTFINMDAIHVFDRNGQFVRKIGEYGWQHGGEFQCPVGICFTPRGELVVADRDNCRVQVLRQDGKLVFIIGPSGGAFELECPTAVAAGSDGSIYVADKSCRIQVFDKQGCFVRTIATQEKLSYPGAHSLAVGADNEVFMSVVWGKDIFDFDRNGVRVVGSTHRTLIGQSASKRGYMGSSVPESTGLAVDSRGRLFVGRDSDLQECCVKMLV